MKRAGRIGIGVSGAGLLILTAFVAHHEGYVPNTYADPVGIPTICYGHTGSDVVSGRVATADECKALLSGDLALAYGTVQRCIRAPMTDWQAAALTSATFNAGPKIVCGSTLGRHANAGRWIEACAELSRWVYARGKKLPGLVKRRAAERAICEGRLDEA